MTIIKASLSLSIEVTSGVASVALTHEHVRTSPSTFVDSCITLIVWHLVITTTGSIRSFVNAPVPILLLSHSFHVCFANRDDVLVRIHTYWKRQRPQILLVAIPVILQSVVHIVKQHLLLIGCIQVLQLVGRPLIFLLTLALLHLKLGVQVVFVVPVAVAALA